MTLRLRLSLAAHADLDDLVAYITEAAGVDIALGYAGDIIKHCEHLAAYPAQGTRRDDIRPGLRTTGFRGRVLIAFAVDDEELVVLIVLYGGREGAGRSGRRVIRRAIGATVAYGFFVTPAQSYGSSEEFTGSHNVRDARRWSTPPSPP